MTETVLHTAADALKAWDSDIPLRAFRVNSDGASQDAIYAAAFEMLRTAGSGAVNSANAKGVAGKLFPNLTAREFDSAFSIAYVARGRGWARMVQEHIHAASPEITIRRQQPANAS